METNLKDINTKLVDISTQYSKFNKNQVLTETQLNGFIDYFEDQDRLSRTSLSGVGIVCGFKVSVEKNNDNVSIKITQGRGVTTDGDLIALQKPSETEEGKKNTTLKNIQLDSRVYKYFKKFSDNEAEYGHFINADKEQINLWELFVSDADSRTILSSFPKEEEPSQDDDGVALNLSDMVVLLYLESYSKNDDLCSQLTCDSQGLEQVSRLRVLLVSEDDAKYIASKDGIYNKHDWYETYNSLPEVSAKRLVVNTKNTKTFRRLKQSYYNTVKNNNVIKNLLKGLDLIIEELGIKENTINPFIQKVFDFNDVQIPIDFQYRYDALKDFIDTYNEIKELLLDLNVHCCPNVGAFPKHLMLGKLVEKKPYATFRHEFYKSPIISCEDNNYKKLMSLLTKLQEISRGYNLSKKEEEIKITPSLALDRLSNKAVPYYYHVTDSVLKHWNFERNQNLRHRFNLSYHTKNLVNVPSIQQPLDHNLDHYNFYRIEGHQGKAYREALEIITKIKEEKGLSFDVKVLSIETDNRNIELKDYKCQFEDLKILLDAWKAEQDCVLGEVSRFLSAFSTESAGKNWLSEKKGYNSLVEARKEKLKEEEIEKQKDIEIDKEKIKEYEEELAKKRKEELSEEENSKIKNYEETLKKLEETGQKEEAEELKKQYELYLKELKESKMSEDEVSKVKEFENSLKELEESGNKEKAEVVKKEYDEYLKGLEEAKMSEADIAKRKEYEASLEKYEASMRSMTAVPVPKRESARVERHSVRYFGDPKKEGADKEAEKEAEAKRREHDAMWQKMGYREEEKEENLKRSKYDDVWSRLGVVNMKAASEREKQKQKSIVKEVLAKEENTVGKSFSKILEENPKASKNEILAILKKEMLDASKGEAWKEKEGMKRFILEDTAEILVNSYVLDKEIPKEIEDIDKEGLSRYKATIDELCELVKRLQSNYDSLDLDSGTKQITGLLISQLSAVCCSGKKLEILYQEIQKRKDNILVQTKLSEFVKNHPGLEHKAGVKPGGTFVMVYLKEAEEERAVYQNSYLEVPFLNQPEVKEEGQGGERGVLQLLSEKYQITFTFVDKYLEESDVSRFEAVVIGETIEGTVKNFAEYLNRMFKIVGLSDQIKAGVKENVLLLGIVDEVIREKTSFIQFENPATVDREGPIYFEPNKIEKSSITEKNTVVADFSLPYMCCSDCTPVNFVIPKEPVKLFLPEKHVCLKEGETIDPMSFKVSPANGEIAALVPKGIQSGLTFDEHGRAFFDGSLTDPSLHGKEIGFTVDDELTDCKVIVYADVPLSVTTSVEYNTLKTSATVVYKASNVYPKLKHKWDFGSGIQSDQAPNADGIIKIAYQLPVGDDNTIKPTLNVTNGVCEKEVQIEPITFDDAIEVSLDIAETHCLDRNATDKVIIPFTNKNPQEIAIEVVGEPVEGLFIENDQLIIDPQVFTKFDQAIKFAIGGMPTNAKITIKAAVEIKIEAQAADYSWNGSKLYRTYKLVMVTSNDDNEAQLTRRWEINGDEKGTEKEIKQTFLIEKDGSAYEIKVDVKDESGCASTEKVTLNIPYPKFEMKMPEGQTEFCLNDDKAYPVSVEPKIPSTPFSGAGISLINGQLHFTPKKTKLTRPASVQIRVAGAVAISLKLKAVPKAKFEWEIIDDVFYVKNTSEIAEKYTYKIGEYTFDRVNRSTLKRSVYEFRTSIIDVSITTHSPCGKDTYEEKGIKLREEEAPSNCAEETHSRIKDDNEKLPKDVDLPSDVLYLVVDQTTMLYNMILSAPQMLNDGMTSGLSEFGNLFTETTSQIDRFIQQEYERGILSQYLIGQVKLFYNMMHCQPHDALMADEQIISLIMEELMKGLDLLRSRQIKFDDKNELKDFLKMYLESPEVVEFVKQITKDKVLPEIL